MRLYISRIHAVYGLQKYGCNMTGKSTYRTFLVNELCKFSRNGVELCVNGEPVASEKKLAEMILAENGCTYMRNYNFEGNKITKIEFDKVKLEKL